jgi:hypothetical protein
LTLPAAPGGSWSETTLYAFIGGSDGEGTNGGVVFDKAGNLYGSTVFGGSDVGPCGPPERGCGTVFELSPPSAPGGTWTETILYSFNDNGDGAVPEAPVILDNAGNVFGTTHTGDTPGCFDFCGTLFELAPSGGVWTETVIHDFGRTPNDGANPRDASLLMTASGAIVGTTPDGGANGAGAVFGVLPPSRSGGQWLYGVLYSLRSFSDGVGPLGGVININGMLYGSTAGGGVNNDVGTVFQLTRVGLSKFKETGLYSFKGAPGDGSMPASPLLFLNSALFGTTQEGGTSNLGTVFEIGP